MADALAVHDVGHDYGEGTVIDGITLTVPRGELLAVLGASGSGKTTLLRAIAGFVTPRSGRIVVDGETVVDRGREHIPAERRGLGVVFQDYALFNHMTVRDNVGFGLTSSADRTTRVDGLLRLVGLTELEGRRPAELSGGQQQRVALARALAPEPRLLLLDEPFANLDAALRAVLGDELRRILAETRVAAFMVTHDREEAMGLADRVAILGDGRLLQWDTPEELYRRPNSSLVAEMTGVCTLIRARATGSQVETSFGVLPLCESRDGEVLVVLRPEHLEFRPADSGNCRVRDRRFRGADHLLHVETPKETVTVIAPADAAPPPGTSGQLRAEVPLWAIAPAPGDTSRG